MYLRGCYGRHNVQVEAASGLWLTSCLGARALLLLTWFGLYFYFGSGTPIISPFRLAHSVKSSQGNKHFLVKQFNVLPPIIS